MNEEEIKQMSDEELVNEIIEPKSKCFNYGSGELKQELLSRLSKNSVEDYKKRLVEEIEKIRIDKNTIARMDKEDTDFNDGVNEGFGRVLDLINNLK